MYSIDKKNYHYYYELTHWLNLKKGIGYTVIQIIDICSSGDNEKMHTATVLFKR